jgi:hypothetical protein
VKLREEIAENIVAEADKTEVPRRLEIASSVKVFRELHASSTRINSNKQILHKVQLTKNTIFQL